MLGIIWSSHHDSLKYLIGNDLPSQNHTKRNVLSAIAKIFDPLGLVGPTTVQAKLIMQQLWTAKLSWDEELSPVLSAKWSKFIEQVIFLNKLEIPRCTIANHEVSVQIHGFCDSSEKAYGACVYLRTYDGNNSFMSNLLCAKSRVAPLKSIELPKLELCGALLLANLVDKVKSALTCDIEKTVYWSDSTIVLGWLNRDSSNWKTFVANRVSQIQRLSLASQWKHVRSPDNPADIISRGADAHQLQTLKLWWHGPEFLTHNEKDWPELKLTRHESNSLPEFKRRNINSFMVMVDQTIFHKFSSLMKLRRVVAYCMRFINSIIKRKDVKYTNHIITVDELDAVDIILVRMVQASSFSDELRALKMNANIHRKSKLLSLNPSLDTNGLIRVGGRLNKSTIIGVDQRNPIIIPNNHIFTSLIIRHEHFRLMHAGTQTVLTSIRNLYWPLKGRSTVRNELRKCVVCFRYRPRNVVPIMADLPSSRVNPNRPFNICGVDYAGPILVKDGKTRNRKIVKSYLCVFVCFATKAIHLELVSDLTTEAFLNSLKRFVARRGLCNTIHSDNGTNFIGANNELIKMTNIVSSSNFENFIQENKINWKFIPPRSPHFGGIWEAGVKSAKYHLFKTIGNAHFTYEQLYTILTQVEAILNSRPLYPLSSDPQDLNPLTPGHFLIGQPLTALPQHDLKMIELNKLNGFQRMQQIVQHFWQRWSKDYLNELQTRNKWKTAEKRLEVGTMVILKEDNAHPQHWQLGRIVELHPGSDAVTRVATVKFSKGMVKCSVAKLCPLPIDDAKANQ